MLIKSHLKHILILRVTLQLILCYIINFKISKDDKLATFKN